MGLALFGAGNYWFSLMNLDVSPWVVMWPRVVTIIGLSMIFAPLNVAAYMYMPKHLRAAAVGLFSLLRNEGGSVGTSIAKTIHDRRLQFHTLRLNEGLDPLNPAVNTFLDQAQSSFLEQTGDPALSQQMALQSLANIRDQQVSSLSYFDVFWVLGLNAILLLVIVFFMRRSVAEKGAHIAAE
jgi:DHA2 family multidrug resistance protein